MAAVAAARGGGALVVGVRGASFGHGSLVVGAPALHDGDASGHDGHDEHDGESREPPAESPVLALGATYSFLDGGGFGVVQASRGTQELGLVGGERVRSARGHLFGDGEARPVVQVGVVATARRPQSRRR